MYYLYSFSNIICQEVQKIVEYGLPTSTMVKFETAGTDLIRIVKREIYKEYSLIDIAGMENYTIILAKNKDSVLNKVFVLCKDEEVLLFEKDILKIILNQRKLPYFCVERNRNFLSNLEEQKRKRILSTSHSHK